MRNGRIGGAYAATVVAAVAVTLAACGGSGEPQDRRTSTSTSTTGGAMGTGSSTGNAPARPRPSGPNPTASTANPTGPSTSSAGGSGGVAGIPPAAKAHTKAGAEAYVRYYFAQFDNGYRLVSPVEFSGLGLDSCRTCRAFSDQAQTYRDRGESVEGNPWVPEVVTASVLTASSAEVIVSGHQETLTIRNAAGSVVRTAPKHEASLVIYLKAVEETWRVSEIKVLK